ncbi:MAG: hypothetical protein AAFX44_08705 [Pseudomonadota bacterium]
MKIVTSLVAALLLALASPISSAQEDAGPHAAGRGADTEGRLVAGPEPASTEQLEDALTKVGAAIAPLTLAELAAPAADDAMAVSGGGVVMPMQSVQRDDGVTLTIMSAQRSADQPPTNVGIWHGSGGGGLGAILGGSVGKLALRLHDPDEDAAPFGFRRVRLFAAGEETEYEFAAGEWVVRRYEDAER